MNGGDRITKQIKNYLYSREQQIGKGLTSQVFRGTNLTTEEPVAIKVIDTKGNKTDVEHMLLRNEIKAVKMMAHENVILTYEVCQTANNVYIIGELCQQGDIGAVIKEHGPFKEEEALSIFKQIMKGLQHIHSKGVIHRDVKTANILLKKGVPKIADFGFAEFISERQGGGYNVGSPLYMSPEAYRKSQYSDKSDTWAAGVILYEMLIGQQPFKGVDYNTMVKQVASADCYRNLNVSSFTKMLLSRLLSIDVDRRAGTNQALTLLGTTQQKVALQTPVVRPSSQNHPRETMVVSKFPLKSRCPEAPHVTPCENKGQVMFSDQRKNVSVSPLAVNRQTQFRTHQELGTPSTISPKKTQLRVSNEPEKPQSSTNKLSSKLDVVEALTTGCQFFSRDAVLYRLYLLTAKHIQHLFKGVEAEVCAAPPSDKLRNTLMVLNCKIKQLISNAHLERAPADPYFTHMATQTPPDSPAFLDYLQFWLRNSVATLQDSLRKQQQTPMDQQHLPQTFSSAAHAAHYYLFLETLKRKNEIASDTPFLRLARDRSGPIAQNIQQLNELTQTLIMA